MQKEEKMSENGPKNYIYPLLSAQALESWSKYTTNKEKILNHVYVFSFGNHAFDSLSFDSL